MDLGGSQGLIPPNYQDEPGQIVTKSISFLLQYLIFLVEIDLLKISMSMIGENIFISIVTSSSTIVQ